LDIVKTKGKHLLCSILVREWVSGLMKGLVLTSTVFFLSSCIDSKSPYENRLEALNENKKTLNIALAWPYNVENRGTKTSIIQGVDLAVKEINANGGILNRKIKIIKFDDGRSINDGMKVAQKIADDKSLFAVIGHLDSYISVPTSTTYEFSGLITINPGSTDAKLTLAGYPHLFRLISKNAIQGEKMAEYFQAKGLKKIVIYYVNNSYGMTLANAFERVALDLGITVVDRRAYDKSSRDHSRTMQDWRQFYQFDAIFLAGSMPEGPEIIRQAKFAGITEGIYAGAGLDSLAFLESGGADVENTNVVSFVPLDYKRSNRDLDIDDSEIRRFADAYYSEYGSLPREAAPALGFDSVMLLAKAVEKVGSLDRDKVSEEIRNSKGWVGSTGIFNFDENGDVDDKLMVINQVINGEFTFANKIN
jgi:branched-chain amino acid transport system substrate-binding protein